LLSLRRNMPQWQATARIDDAGSANFAAMAATMGRLVFAATENRAAEPVLFLPLVERGRAVPVRVVDVHVSDEKLTLLVEPLTATQRRDFLSRVRIGAEADASPPQSP